MPPTVYLVSGANRGIGLGLVTLLAQRPNTIVFAGARNPSAATDLHALSAAHPDTVHIVTLTSADREDNVAAVDKIKQIGGRLDIVIANAGIANYFGASLETPDEVMREHYQVNVIGTLVLFQCAYSLLSISTDTPKFVMISSGAGSIEDGARIPVGMLAYGASKAAENYLARKLHFECPGLVCFPISPGGVATDMAAFASKEDPMMQHIPLITVEHSATSIIKLVDEVKREEDGPRLVNYDGTLWKW